MSITESRKLYEDINCTQAPEEDTKTEDGVDDLVAGELGHEIVNMGDKVAREHQFEQVGG